MTATAKPTRTIPAGLAYYTREATVTGLPLAYGTGRDAVPGMLWFVDTPVSGDKPFAHRPAACLLMGALRRGEVQRVRVDAWDRLGRTQAIIDAAVAAIEAAGGMVEVGGASPPGLGRF